MYTLYLKTVGTLTVTSGNETQLLLYFLQQFLNIASEMSYVNIYPKNAFPER